MSLRQLKPTSPGTRFRRAPEYPEVSTGNKPLKALTKGKKRISGRNHKGRITIVGAMPVEICRNRAWLRRMRPP